MVSAWKGVPRDVWDHVLSSSSSGKGPWAVGSDPSREHSGGCLILRRGKRRSRAALSLAADCWSSQDENSLSVFSLALLPLPKPPVCQQLGQECGRLEETAGHMCHHKYWGASPSSAGPAVISAPAVQPQMC